MVNEEREEEFEQESPGPTSRIEVPNTTQIDQEENRMQQMDFERQQFDKESKQGFLSKLKEKIRPKSDEEKLMAAQKELEVEQGRAEILQKKAETKLKLEQTRSQIRKAGGPSTIERVRTGASTLAGGLASLGGQIRQPMQPQQSQRPARSQADPLGAFLNSQSPRQEISEVRQLRASRGVQGNPLASFLGGQQTKRKMKKAPRDPLSSFMSSNSGGSSTFRKGKQDPLQSLMGGNTVSGLGFNPFQTASNFTKKKKRKQKRRRKK